MRVTVKIEGAKELNRRLATLSRATQRNVVRRAIRRAVQPLIERARSLAPDRDPSVPGLRESISVGNVKARYKDYPPAPGEIVQWVGPIALPHAHLVEFGTAPRRQHSTGRYTGAMPPHPFLRPAWDAEGETVLRLLSEMLQDEIDKSVARAQRRAQRRAGS